MLERGYFGALQAVRTNGIERIVWEHRAQLTPLSKMLNELFNKVLFWRMVLKGGLD